MTRQRPPSETARGPSPAACRSIARRALRRSGPVLSLLLALSVCALAGAALFAPRFVFGAEDEAPPASAAVVATASTTIGPSASTADGPPTPAMAAEAALATLPWGSGEGQVGLERPTGELARGPEALAVAPDGRVAVLDSVNRRLVLLDPCGGFASAIALPLAEPRFLAVDDRFIHVLDSDTDRTLFTVTWSGVAASSVALPAFEEPVSGLFATSRGPCLEMAHQQQFLLAQTGRSAAQRAAFRSLPGRPLDSGPTQAVKASFKPGQGVRLKSFHVKADLSGTQIADLMPDLAPGRAVEHLVSVDGDGRGGLIVGARLLEEQNGFGAGPCLVLAHLPSAGPSGDRAQKPGTGDQVAATLLLDDFTWAYVGQPYAVAPDGRVFQPMAEPDGYGIVVHTFAQSEEVAP